MQRVFSKNKLLFNIVQVYPDKHGRISYGEIVSGFLTADEVAKELKITSNAVARLCRDKKLGASHPGRKWLIPRESLDEYLQIRR